MVTELAYRCDGGIEVRLGWDRLTDEVTISVADTMSGEAFVMSVPPGDALDGFYHPYAYAAHIGVTHRSVATHPVP